MAEEEPDPTRRALIGVLVGVPLAAEAVEFVFAAVRRRIARDAVKIPARRADVDGKGQQLFRSAGETAREREQERR